MLLAYCVSVVLLGSIFVILFFEVEMEKWWIDEMEIEEREILIMLYYAIV